MTSARNHRLLLSGSNIWLLLLCLLCVGACASQKKGGGPPKGYEVVGDTKTDPKTPKPAPAKTQKDTVPIPKDVVKPGSGKYTHKPVYNVALVLPFYLDSFPTANGGIYPPSRIGVEYYRGVLLALDTLKTLGLSVKLHVYDSYPETYLDVLIKSGALKQMDLIIGPVFNSSMKLMAQYAQTIGVPVWSPFSPASDITTHNPFFFMSNPRMETHARQMMQYVADTFKESKITILYQNNDQEKEYLNLYRKFVADYNKAIDDSLKVNTRYRVAKLVVNEKLIEGYGKISTGQLSTMLKDGEHNLFIVPSMKVPFLVNLLREFYPLAASNLISIIGTPTFGNDVDLQLDYINALDVHYTQSYFLKPGFYESGFYAAYWAQHKVEPSEYAVNGYDQMLYLGIMLKKYGINFRVESGNEVVEGLGNGFSINPVFAPVVDVKAPPAINYWDNQHVYILRVKDFTVERVR